MHNGSICCYTEKQPFTSIRWYNQLIACIKENAVTIQTDFIPDETIYPATAVPFSEVPRSMVFDGRFVSHLATFLTSLTVRISFGVSQKDTESLIIQCIPDMVYVLVKANREPLNYTMVFTSSLLSGSPTQREPIYRFDWP